MKVRPQTKAEIEARAIIKADFEAGKIDQEQYEFVLRWLEETVAMAYKMKAERQKGCRPWTTQH